MMKFLISLFILIISSNAQLRLTIDTDKDVYEYGETIRIYCTLHNDDDTSVTFFASDYNSCQAEFFLNDHHSYDWEACLPTVQEITFPPHSQRIYSWTIDPYVYGLPDKDGEQVLIGYYRPGSNTFSTDHLRDTTTFYAPEFLGGQLDVGFFTELQTRVDSVRESFNAELISHIDFDALGQSGETWLFLGTRIATAKAQLEKNELFEYVSYKRRGLVYDSIFVTTVKKIDDLEKDFSLYQNYPNPFNPSTKIKFTIPNVVDAKFASTTTKIVVYDILGREVKTLLNKKLSPGSYEVEFDGSNLPSGVYLYRLEYAEIFSVKKMLLMK